jgi:hypothetical protein
VLISHAHDDHLSAETLAKFRKWWCCVLRRRRRICEAHRAKALKPGEDYRAGECIIAAAVHHPHTWAPTRRRTDAGWVIVAGATVFYSGDTNHVSSFADVGWTMRARHRNPQRERASPRRTPPAQLGDARAGRDSAHWGATHWSGGTVIRVIKTGEALLGDRLRVLAGKSFARRQRRRKRCRSRRCIAGTPVYDPTAINPRFAQIFHEAYRPRGGVDAAADPKPVVRSRRQHAGERRRSDPFCRVQLRRLHGGGRRSGRVRAEPAERKWPSRNIATLDALKKHQIDAIHVADLSGLLLHRSWHP